jgi:hypothetical protein
VAVTRERNKMSTIYITQALINETTCEIRSYTEVMEGETWRGFAEDENGNPFVVEGEVSEIFSSEILGEEI